MESKTVYFEDPDGDYTDEVLRITRQRAKELGIKTIVVASIWGDTAVKAAEALSGFRIVVVGSATGATEPNLQRFKEENRKILESKGVPIIHTAHALAGVSRALRLKFETMALGEIIAHTLRIFGQGTKVACEIALMAADAGLVRTDEDVIAIAGRSKGANTAIVLQPANSHTFFDLKVKETLCKPRL